MILKYFLIVIISVFFLTSCNKLEDPPHDELTVSVTTWIGYSPLYYAYEKGWLQKENIRLVTISSLSENMYLFKTRHSDIYGGTQYEYLELKPIFSDLKPCIMLDKSNGGDMIMSNRTLDELRKEKVIDVYLEVDSINKLIIEDFISSKELKTKKLIIHNSDQVSISSQRFDMNKPTIIVTYVPYDNILDKKGFKEIISTKDGLDLLVIDALFTTSETYNNHEHQMKSLKRFIDLAITASKENPKEYYSVISKHIENFSYTNYNDAINDIIWINSGTGKLLEDKLHRQGVEMDTFICK